MLVTLIFVGAKLLIFLEITKFFGENIRGI